MTTGYVSQPDTLSVSIYSDGNYMQKDERYDFGTIFAKSTLFLAPGFPLTATKVVANKIDTSYNPISHNDVTFSGLTSPSVKLKLLPSELIEKNTPGHATIETTINAVELNIENLYFEHEVLTLFNCKGTITSVFGAKLILKNCPDLVVTNAYCDSFYSEKSKPTNIYCSSDVVLVDSSATNVYVNGSCQIEGETNYTESYCPTNVIANTITVNGSTVTGNLTAHASLTWNSPTTIGPSSINVTGSIVYNGVIATTPVFNLYPASSAISFKAGTGNPNGARYIESDFIRSLSLNMRCDGAATAEFITKNTRIENINANTIVGQTTTGDANTHIVAGKVKAVNAATGFTQAVAVTVDSGYTNSDLPAPSLEQLPATIGVSAVLTLAAEVMNDIPEPTEYVNGLLVYPSV